MTDLRTIDSSILGTDGPPIVYPFWVRFKMLAQFSPLFDGITKPVRHWTFALWGAAAATFAVLVIANYSLPPWWALLGLSVIGGVAERQSVPVTGQIETSVSFLPFVFAAVAYGPLAAAVICGVANLVDLRPPLGRWLVYTPARVLTGAATGFAALAIEPSGSGGFARILLASLAAAVANLACDGIFNSLTLIARGSGNALAFVRTIGPLLALSLPLYVPLVALLVYAYRASSIWVVATFLLPTLALQGLIHLYQEQRHAALSLGIANRRLERANLSFATALVATLEARDRYTAGHSAAVAVFSRDIARRMGLSDEEQHLTHLCGLVHDIGKVGLPAGLLEKPGSLTLEERRQMEAHSAIGERILSKVDDYGEIATIVRHHHERVDGFGYPDGLRADEIPLVSRIIAVADAYDAMTSDRPYRDAMPSRVARLRLAQAVETQFDTAVVAAFEAILAGSSESYKSRVGDLPNLRADVYAAPAAVTAIS
jgi:putative nucleotidyltransferase with HDIG domain